ncbi:ShKT domain-containing protein [Strongyloides ratti]|uniref:ShKT domain-containing protein n=1 Tax=Strongyloides ratti TaxID=34506 RepID=A0A090LLT9_STRRB|nr:ShKT domain-containing protein [Strongyloides ratti]CEF68525.1 ShKT domain-containing protein [Strongyloides ratti]
MLPYFFILSIYFLYYVFGDNDKCVDQNPYCTKNDCTVRPGYAMEYCKKTCGDCDYFCQDSTYISCVEARKEDCNDVLKEYCPILCGVCEKKNNTNMSTTIIYTSTSTSLPEVKILKVEKNETLKHEKTLKDDAITNSDETFSQRKTLRNDNWYDNQHNRKLQGQQNRYYGSQTRHLPSNMNSPHSSTQMIDPLIQDMSDSYVERESFPNPNIPIIGNDNTNIQFNSLSQREIKRKEIDKEPHFINDYKLRRRPQNIENMVEKETDIEYEDYEDQPKTIPIKKKNRGNKHERIDENTFLQNTILPLNQKNSMNQGRANIENEYIPRTSIKSNEEIEDKVNNLPPLAIADLITLLGCRDRDQQICNKITEEACRARPGFYLKICPVRCKNCNGLLCMDSNKVDCLEVKRLGGCRLQMSEEYCPRTCNACPTPTILAETTSVCKDEMDTCEQLAESGVCNNPISTAVMRVYCAKSCNFCKNTHLYLSNSEEDDHPVELNALWMLKKQEKNIYRYPQRNPSTNPRH